MAYTASDAFCAQVDVEGLVGRGAFTSATKPSAQQCLDWMARIAAEVEAKLVENGSSYTVSTHGNVFPTTPTDAKTWRLKVLAESANALGAAAQLLYMHDVKDEYGRVPMADGLFKQYAGILESIASVLLMSGSYASCSTDNTDDLEFLKDTGF